MFERPQITDPWIGNTGAVTLEIQSLSISVLRTDGDTQQRVSLDRSTVENYAARMREGIGFPPVRVWWDGHDWWLTDGFHRLAAAKEVGCSEISCEVCRGSLSDAQWDSYAANTTHGLRRTAAEMERVIALTIRHTNASALSNVEIARHLNIAEATVRRWRQRFASTACEERVRIVTRNGSRYVQKIGNIGRNGQKRRRKSQKSLQEELKYMKEMSSPAARRTLNVVDHWVCGDTPPKDCLAALERIAQTCVRLPP